MYFGWKCGIFEGERRFALEKSHILSGPDVPAINQVQSDRSLYNGFRKCVIGRGLFLPRFILISKTVIILRKVGWKSPITN